MVYRFKGCYTAIITPFDGGRAVDWSALMHLVEFQVSQGITGVVPAGTTGESPTLSWDEHNRVIETVFDTARSRVETIAGTGSNSTEEALEATRHVANRGLKAALLVDPYYNGPSSLEMRREYYEPIAEAFPDIQLIPYIIPGRTGTQLLPQDLGILVADYPNVSGVKEATGSLDNARLTRNYCGQNFSIISGDDDRTLALMSDQAIRSSGVISVVSNIVPAPTQSMVQAALSGDWDKAQKLATGLQPLRPGHDKDGRIQPVRPRVCQGKEPSSCQDDDVRTWNEQRSLQRTHRSCHEERSGPYRKIAEVGLGFEPGVPRTDRGGLRRLHTGQAPDAEILGGAGLPWLLTGSGCASSVPPAGWAAP